MWRLSAVGVLNSFAQLSISVCMPPSRRKNAQRVRRVQETVTALSSVISGAGGDDEVAAQASHTAARADANIVSH